MILNSSKPIFLQIKDYYEKLIDNGVLKEGDSLPSVREIALFFKINPNTAQRALTLMVEEGYVVNIAKKGFYVNKVKKNKDEIISRYIKELEESNISKEDVYEYLRREMEL